MSFADDLKAGGWTTPSLKTDEQIRKYSTTGDILAFKRCRRQYGMFSVRGFSPASDTQAYFGTLTHDVLDAVNRQYKTTKLLPSVAEIETLVDQAHDRLWRSGVRPYNAKQQRERVAKLIHRFVELTGHAFFKHVKETEYLLERALTTHKGRPYVLSGVVDVLAGAVSNDLGLAYATDAEDVEIWDYKSGKRPEKTSPILRDYEYQMRMYARIYELRTGQPPARCVLVFLGELADDDSYKLAKGKASRFPDLFYPVHPEVTKIAAVEKDFHDTVEAIEDDRAKGYENQWLAPTIAVDDQTCEACDLRYNCTNYATGGKLRNEPL